MPYNDYKTCTMPEDGRRTGEQDTQPRLHSRHFSTVAETRRQRRRLHVRLIRAGLSCIWFKNNKQEEDELMTVMATAKMITYDAKGNRESGRYIVKGGCLHDQTNHR